MGTRIKRQADIAPLSAKLQTLALPKFDLEFDKAREWLRALVGAHFGYQAEQSFDYDDREQVFFWNEGEYPLSYRDDFPARVEVSRTYEINPRADLAAELARVVSERQAFAALCQSIRSALKEVR